MPEWKQEILNRLASLKLAPAREAEIAEELSQHLEDRYLELVARGIAEEEARRIALEELSGGLASHCGGDVSSPRGFGEHSSPLQQQRRRDAATASQNLLVRGLWQVERQADPDPIVMGAGGRNYFMGIGKDVRYALRQLRRNPAFAAVAILTLALGIGANTAIFTIVNAVVLRPLPYSQSDRLMWITEFIPALKAQIVGGGDYADWKEQNKTLEQIAAYDDAPTFNQTGRGTPARIHAAQVSASFFATLGVEPQLGRAFTTEEDQPNRRKAVILMHAFWQQYFGSDAHVLGQTITLDATPYAIVGVMPANFKFPGETETQMLLPLQINEANERLRQMQRLVHVIGRLKSGVTAARVANDLDAIRKRAQAATPQPGPGGPGPSPMGTPPPGPGANTMTMRFENPAPPPGAEAGMTMRALPPGTSAPNRPAGPAPARGPDVAQPAPAMRQAAPGPQPAQGAQQRAGSMPAGNRPMQLRMIPPPDREMRIVPLAEHLAGNLRPAMLTMLGVVALVLLIACANVANLMLARAAARTREVAVRTALGAKRWRLVRQLLTESVVLALGGGAAGLLLAIWGVGAMTRLIPPSMGGEILNLTRPHADWAVLSFALVVSILTGALFGLAPAISATRLDLVEQLKDGAQAVGSSAGRHWFRGALAVAELSLALVLLIGAGLLIKSFYQVLTVDPGFAPERVLTMNLSLTRSRYPSPQQRADFFSKILRRVESLPGVRSAAVGDSLPLSPYRARLMFPRELLNQQGGNTPEASLLQMTRLAVSPAYFYTLGIPVRKGRTFTDGDDAQSPKVAVVNEALAQQVWPGQDPVGKDLPMFGGAPDEKMTIVGVVGNSHHEGLGENIESEIYVPYLQNPQDAMQLALRTSVDPASLGPAVRREVAEIDPEQPIYNLTTLEQTLSESVAPRRFDMLLLVLFAAIALAWLLWGFMESWLSRFRSERTKSGFAWRWARNEVMS